MNIAEKISVAIFVIAALQVYFYFIVGEKKLPIEDISFPDFVAEVDSEKSLVIAYAITILKVNSGHEAHFLYDAIEILSLSIDDACSRSIYQCDKVAFVSPSVSLSSRKPLEKLGWHILERDVPLDVSKIKGEKLRNRIDKSGCCGDIDTIILQPFDEIFGLDVEFVYTVDVNMAPSQHNMPVQGGFLLCKPNMTTFEELVSIVEEGDWAPGSGWGNSGIGFFYGGPTIQGLLAYFYRYYKSPTISFEADRCKYNHMWDTDECRRYNIEEIYSIHYTMSCPKPWFCDVSRVDGCRILTEKWYYFWKKARNSIGESSGEPCVMRKYIPIR